MQRNRALQKEMKQAYQFYVEGNYDAFDVAMARIIVEWGNDLTKYSDILENAILRRFLLRISGKKI